LPDGHPRIQRGKWVLKHNLRVSPKFPQPRTIKAKNVLPMEQSLAARRLSQPQNCSADRGFPGAGFACEAEHFMAADRKRYILNSMNLA
jgi:hypothetical protein